MRIIKVIINRAAAGERFYYKAKEEKVEETQTDVVLLSPPFLLHWISDHSLDGCWWASSYKLATSVK